MRRFVLMFAALSCVACASSYASDDTPSSIGMTEVRPFVGAFIPTGALHKDLKSAVLAGAQVGYQLPAPFRIVGTLGWSPSKDRAFSQAKLNLYQYDVGMELAPAPSSGDVWKLGPFVGVGLGGRTYSFNNTATNKQTDFDGYGAIGGELSSSKIGARIELRDYGSRFKGLEGTEKLSTRNDVMLAGALTFHI